MSGKDLWADNFWATRLWNIRKAKSPIVIGYKEKDKAIKRDEVHRENALAAAKKGNGIYIIPNNNKKKK